MKIAVAAIGSYLLGGFLGGALAARFKGIDLRRHGSGNPGTANVLRTIGPFYALITFLIDAGKGMAAVALGRWTGSPGIDALCGLLAIAGHNWPLSAAFRGGKGIATTIGTMILLVPKTLPILLPLWAILALPTGYFSLGSLGISLALPPLVAVFYRRGPGGGWLLFYAAASAIMAVYQHRENIFRLWRGEEHRSWPRRKGGDGPPTGGP